MNLLNDERGQVSAELIIIIAAVLAIALVMIQNLNTTAKASVSTMNRTSVKVLEEIGKI